VSSEFGRNNGNGDGNDIGVQQNAGGELKSWMCLICGWIYDEAAGLPEEGIAPGTRWEDVPMNWTCPECGARKDDFEMVAL
jgi:rubredoxin